MIEQIVIERCEKCWRWDVYNEGERPLVSGTCSSPEDALDQVRQLTSPGYTLTLTAEGLSNLEKALESNPGNPVAIKFLEELHRWMKR